ncbi:MAG TPA: DUF488 family protein [Polyangia bacterium]
MPVRTRRWNDPAAPEEGTGAGLRVLVSRYRPRGVSKSAETWDEWWPELGPSRALHAAFYGKGEEGEAAAGGISFEEYAPRYLEEMQAQVFRIRALADRVAAGETVTLLCSSACTDPARCHRTLLQRLIETRVAGNVGKTLPKRRPAP